MYQSAQRTCAAHKGEAIANISGLEINPHSGHRLHQRANNLYVAMDDDHPDINGYDDDQDVDVDGAGRRRRRRDSTGDDAGATSRVIIDRDCYSMPKFREKHGYQSVGELKPKEWARGKLKRCRCGLDKIQGLFLYIFPALDWLRRYNLRSNALGDLMAGITVSIVNIPQSMAFALLNVLPPVYGLYTAFFAPLAFFLMGSSRHSSVGTFGVVSILCGDAVERIISERYPNIEPITDIPTIPSSSPPSSSLSTIFPTTFVMNATTPAPCGPICDERIQMQTTLCLMVGLIQILMAICRLGFVTTYLAQPLICAFTTGAACHMITSQVVPLFGLVLPRYAGPLSLIYTWRDIFINISQTNVATMLFGLLVFLILAPGKYLSERYKHKIKIQIPWELLVISQTYSPISSIGCDSQ